MNIREIEYPSLVSGTAQRPSWGAILAGAVTCLAVMLALAALGAGIGLVSAPAADTAEGLAMGLGVGGALWTLLSGVAAFYAGGWVTGRTQGIARISESVVNGSVTWAVATLAIAFVFASATIGAIGATASAVGSAAGIASRGDARELGRRMFPGIEAPEGERTAREAGRAAAENAGTAARAAGAAGLFGFFLMLCEGLACCLGARNGTRLLRPVSGPPSPAAQRREATGVRG